MAGAAAELLFEFFLRNEVSRSKWELLNFSPSSFLHFRRLVPRSLTSLDMGLRRVMPSPTQKNFSSLEGSAETTHWMKLDFRERCERSVAPGRELLLRGARELDALGDASGGGLLVLHACWEWEENGGRLREEERKAGE